MGSGRVRTERAARFRYTLDFLTGRIDAACGGACKRELVTLAGGVT
jgi:hypothetical protein